MTKASGFSLIELMITVVIISIITSIALPSYRQHVIRTHRGDATQALLRIAAEQEKFYMQNNTYTANLTDLKITETNQDFYNLAIDSADATAFVASATPDASGPQKKDLKCTVFRINSAGTRLADNDSGGDNSDYCWK